MATFYLRYELYFESLRDHTQYQVQIFEQTNGDKTILTGADQPFETYEEDSDDLWLPVRRQTGVLRIVDETSAGNLLSVLLPSSNIEKKVLLYSGTWNAASTVFTQSQLEWVGFMCAQASTQPWDKQKKVIEIPLKSFITALEDSIIPASKASIYTNIAKLLQYAFESVSTGPNEIYISDYSSTVISQFFHAKISWINFFRSYEINNQGDSQQCLVGMSYLDAIKYICQLYGYTLRYFQDSIVLAKYYNSQSTFTLKYFSYNKLVQLANGESPTASTFMSTIKDLLGFFTFVGSDNTSSKIIGHKAVQVTLPLNDTPPLHINLPETTEDSSTVYPVTVSDGTVNVQPHQPRSNNLETFFYWKYQNGSYPGYGDMRPYINNTILSASVNYLCVANSVLSSPQFDPRDPDTTTHGGTLYAGAFPVRWLHLTPSSGQTTMINGLFLNQQYMLNANNPGEWDYIYKIQSAMTYKFEVGYININMQCFNFNRGPYAGSNYNLYFANTDKTTYLECTLQWGNYFWDGEDWVIPTGNDISFTIEFEGVNIKSNRTADMNVSSTSGYFVPSLQNVEGNITFGIISLAGVLGIAGYEDSHSRIISNLVIDFLQPPVATASSRLQNTYRKENQTFGLSEDKEINLLIGTFNNNIYSPVFIRDSNDGFLELVGDQRPEIRLATEMAAYYSKALSTFIGLVSSGLDLCRTIYRMTDNSVTKYFAAICIDKKWRDDSESVKFIENT